MKYSSVHELCLDSGTDVKNSCSQGPVLSGKGTENYY